MSIGDSLKMLDKMESGRRGAWRQPEKGGEADEHFEDPPAEIKNELNSAQLSQACKGVNFPMKETAFRMPWPHLLPRTQVSPAGNCQICNEDINIGQRMHKHSKMCLCMEWLTRHSEPTHPTDN